MPMNILIVRLSSLGDIVHTYPMLYDIKTKLDNCTVDWLVDNDFASLVKLNPLVDNMISIPLRMMAKNKLTLIPKFLHWHKTLKHKFSNKHYDYIIDSQGLLKSAILSRCFNGTIVGLGKNSIKEKLATLFYHHKHEVGSNHLAITKNRLFAAKILNYTIDTNQVNFGLCDLDKPISNQSVVLPGTPLFNLTNNKYAIFFHATSKDSKKYPLEKWAALASYMINVHNLDVILPFGSQKEHDEAIELQQSIDTDISHVVVPKNKLNYTELVTLIMNAEVVFGVDTGLVHLANALNKKLIAIYVDTNPDKTGVFVTNLAKNVGGIGKSPDVHQIISLFENIN